MKEAYYFSHDVNAHSDPKIMAMRSVYKAEGYGYYWIVVEMMAEQAEYKLPHKEWLYDALAMRMQCDSNAAAKYVEDCIDKYELFESDGTYFWSNSLCRRMEMKRAAIEKKTEKARKAAQKRWESSETNAQAMQMQCTSNADAMRNDANKRKEKESKEKKKDVCAEQAAAPPVITLTLNDGTEYPITQEQVDGWKELYPAVDVMQQLRSMKGWLDANKTKRKTKSGILRFVVNWLSREQDRGRASPQRSGAKPNYFASPVEDYDKLAVDLWDDEVSGEPERNKT